MPEGTGKLRVAAIVLVGLLLAAAVASSAFPVLRACRDRLAETGTAGVVNVCEPVFSDVAILGLAVMLVALILLPVLSKFDVAGILSIELKAEKAQKDADEARAVAESVRRQATEL